MTSFRTGLVLRDEMGLIPAFRKMSRAGKTGFFWIRKVCAFVIAEVKDALLAITDADSPIVLIIQLKATGPGSQGRRFFALRPRDNHL